MSRPKPVVLCILDGWGIAPPGPANAPHLAKTPNFDRIWSERPTSTLVACGTDVGLPEGQMGNSEVGHMNIGAGRVVWMDLPRIEQAIADGSLAANPALAEYCDKLRQSGGKCHLMGLVSPGGVHAHQDHMVALAKAVSSRGVPVVIHAFLDGRDTAPKSAREHMANFQADLEVTPDVTFGTVMGRYYAMDRDRRWDRVQPAWEALVEGWGTEEATPDMAIQEGYRRRETDEFLTPTILPGHEGIKGEDGILFANFRADRARQILGALLDEDFDAFDRGPRRTVTAALGMVSYSDRLNQLMGVMFPQQEIRHTLGEWVSEKGLRQFRLAETEKYPHVTFFLNGGVEDESYGERRHMAESPKVRTYDMNPEMAAEEVTEELVKAIRGDDDLIVVNYANPDMVGHTGSLSAAITACETVDQGLGLALEALEEMGGAMIVTADHGNCEMMVDPDTGERHTAHTLNPVPVILIEPSGQWALRDGGRLADLAPTLLQLLELDQPEEMTGQSLLAPR